VTVVESDRTGDRNPHGFDRGDSPKESVMGEAFRSLASTLPSLKQAIAAILRSLSSIDLLGNKEKNR
jgi:hypothetical protein